MSTSYLLRKYLREQAKPKPIRGEFRQTLPYEIPEQFREVLYDGASIIGGALSTTGYTVALGMELFIDFVSLTYSNSQNNNAIADGQVFFKNGALSSTFVHVAADNNNVGSVVNAYPGWLWLNEGEYFVFNKPNAQDYLYWHVHGWTFDKRSKR